LFFAADGPPARSQGHHCTRRSREKQGARDTNFSVKPQEKGASSPAPLGAFFAPIHHARSGYCLDLVIATHIDSDHVSGLVPFFRANGLAQTPKINRLGNVFHNSLRDLARVAVQPAATAPADLELLQEIERAG
jgi:hypothetical protein